MKFFDPKVITPSLEVLAPINLNFCRLCHLYPQGVLYDDDKLQIGIQIMVQGTQGRAMLFLGNKSPDPISHITIETWTPHGLDLSVNQATDENSYATGQQTNRMLGFELKGFYSKLPKLSVNFNRAGALENLVLELPIFVSRFIAPLKKSGAEIWQQWQSLSPTEVKLGFNSMNPDIKSMRELAMFTIVGGAAQLYLNSEVPELNPRCLMSAGVSPGGEVIWLIEVDASATQGTVSVRSENVGLRTSMVGFITALVQG